MVIRIIRSTICRPSNLHKPIFCASRMQKTTRSNTPEDEMARRKEYQKLIDYTFGPPNLHESEGTRPELAKEDKDGATKLMENLREKTFHTTHAVLGHAHKATQKGKELPQQDAPSSITNVEQNWPTQDLQEHKMNSQNSPRQAPQTGEPDKRGTSSNAAKENFHQKPSSRDKFGEFTADSSYSYPAHHVGGPHYYRQMEARMYDNFAQKYLRMGTNEIDKLDKLLAKEMESLKLPKSEKKGMRRSINVSDNVNTFDTGGYHTDAPITTAASQTVAPNYNPLYHQCHQWSSHGSQYPPYPNTNAMTTIKSCEDNVEKVKLQSDSQGYYEEILASNITQCSNLPPDLIPDSGNNSPIEKLQLDDNQPAHFVYSAPLVQDSDVKCDDMSRKIIQPIERPDTIFQVRECLEPAIDTSLLEVQVNEQTDKHMMHEHSQIEQKTNSEQSNPLTKMNLIETNISEHVKMHQRSYVQPNHNIEPNTEPLKPWSEDKLKQLMKNHLVPQTRVDPSRDENTVSERRKTDAVERNIVQATPEPLEQQTRANPSQVEHTNPRRTESMVGQCVHAPSISHTEPKTKVAHPVEDIVTNLRLDENLSLSELLQRVRALNRLQYCRECELRVVAAKCPPSDRPECPPPPDCVRECPPPKKPKCPPCPECPPKPACPPPQPKCPSEPKCPPAKPKCPPEPKCPPPQPKCPEKKPKCPSPCPPPPTCPGKCGCLSTDPHDPVTAHYGSMHTLLKSKLEYFKELLNKGLLKLKHSSSLDYVAFTSSPPGLDKEPLQLNRVKDLDPWVPLPSWPYPDNDKKKKLQCPDDGCRRPKPGPVRPNCPPLPCKGFPKRLSFSE